MIVIGLFYAAVFVGLIFTAAVVAERMTGGGPLPPVTQPPPLPGAYAEEVRSRVQSSRSRRVRSEVSEDLQGVSFTCEGHCRARRTLHEDHGDGTATCTRCGAPRHTTDGN